MSDNLEKGGCMKDKLTTKDFDRAVAALRKAHVPGPYKAIYSLETREEYEKRRLTEGREI